MIEAQQLTASSGYLWEDYTCVLMRPGQPNGWDVSAEILQDCADRFNDVPVFLDHRLDGHPVRDLAGMIGGVTWDFEQNALMGVLRLLRSETAVADRVRAFQGHGKVFGLSADMMVAIDGTEIVDITRVLSVDLVVWPAAGGEVLDRVTEGVVIVENETEYRVTMENPPVATVTPPAVDTAQDILSELVEVKLAAAGLPDVLGDAIRLRFKVNGADRSELDAAIAAAKEQWAAALAPHTVKGLGPISRMRNSLDRIEVAFAALMGVPVEGEEVDHRLSGVREMYDMLTGDWERRGVFNADRVQFANATTSTMAVVTANVLNKVLLKGWEQLPLWWKPIAYEEDFPTMQDARWITLGGFSDLDTVAEGASYVEKTWDDYEETSSFLKKGNYIGLTLEMIDKDDVSSFRQVPRKLGLAANRTLSAAVSAIFTANAGVGPTLADGDALFHANHSNLGTTALDTAPWQAAITAMFEQAEYHSAKALGVRPRFCLVPIELESTALGLFTTDLAMHTPMNDIQIARNSANVITVPEWTDANNWAAVADPGQLQGVCVGYRFGRAPELFVADSNVQGSMFTNDEMRVKVRFIYTVGVGDYRGLYKANVA